VRNAVKLESPLPNDFYHQRPGFATAAKMSDDVPETTIIEEAPTNDVEMEGGDAVEAVGIVEGENGEELPFADGDVTEPRTTFLSYLMSPVVTLIIGQENQTLLAAHQALLEQSPYFKAACANFVDDGSVRNLCIILSAGLASPVS
jgi:hypothetical protein